MGRTVRAVLGALSIFTLEAACARAPVVPDKPPSRPPLAAERPGPAAPAETAAPAAPAGPDSISVFFELDSYVLKSDSGPPLQTIAARAKQGQRALRIEGHCDERGTPEYNLALGEGRARSVQEYLERLGFPKDKMTAVSFGSQRPKAQGQDEKAWSQNRRGDVKLD
jgi:peptidoglycan-associated lipoprotein